MTARRTFGAPNAPSGAAGLPPHHHKSIILNVKFHRHRSTVPLMTTTALTPGTVDAD